jgi:8-hydroxy-5-deazaflavin:NADPH oxidoreductase
MRQNGGSTVKIGIIGAGNVGRALAKASIRAGHAITISATNPEKAQRVAAEVGGSAAASNRDAVADADAVILAVPFNAVNTIVNELGSELDGKILIDVTNRFAPEHLEGESNAELIQRMVPEGKVVKAINTIFVAHQADPLIDGIQLDGFVAGDDIDAKQKVLQFIGSLGFRPIDAGPLAMSRALEGMAVLNISLNMTNSWPRQSGWKLLGPTDEKVATTGRAQE